jgi:DNA polymerase-3 subunit chi
MPRVDFYVLRDGAKLDRKRLVCHLAGKAFAQGQRVYIHTDSPAEGEQMDDLLWTFKDISFLPHERIDSRSGDDIPILIGWGERYPDEVRLMVNLAHPAPVFLEGLERVIEVVDEDPETKRQARDRYRFYQKQGYPLDTQEISSI